MHDTPATPPRSWLVLGLSGQVGQALQARLPPDGPTVFALSRRLQPPVETVRWLQGELAAMPNALPGTEAVVSLGPLDAFSRWFEAAQHAPRRVVALGSTSLHGKQGSPDPAERELARRLGEAEHRLAAAAASRGSVLTVLRPTLLYGNGRDQSLSRLVRLARRWRCLPLPRRAAGLRQPVHVDDVAQAVLRCLLGPDPVPGHFDLPGGETLPFDVMVRRALAVAAPGTRILRLPGPMFRAGVRLARIGGRLGPAGEGVLARLDADLAYDPEPVRNALKLQPRGFQPVAEMFPV
jgi:nucleoside-diphosphate-sugar epimerase